MTDELPQGWEPITLGQIGDLHCGQSPSSQTVNSEGHGTLYVTGPEQWDGKRIRQGKWTTDPKRIVPEGCIFVTVKGAGVGTTFPGIACAIGRDVYAYQPSSGVSLGFVHEALQFTIQDVLRHARGDIPGLSRGHIVDHKIGLPPLNEQQQIVAKIEALMARSGRAKEALDAIPALLDRYRQSVLAAAFRGDLTADWRTHHPDSEPASELLTRIGEERQSRLAAMKGRRGKRRSVAELFDSSAEPQVPGYELPNGWSLAWLADLSWHSSYGISSKCDYDFPGSPVLRIPNVANGQLLLDDLKRAGQDSFNDAYAVDLGDLLIVRANGSRNLIGRGAAITKPLSEPTYFASYLIRFRLLGGIDMARWLATLWHSPQVRAQVYEHAATSAGQYNISLTELSGFAIPIPPLDELRVICQRVETALASTDAVADQVREATGRASVFEQSILAKAFRGEMVPQDPNDEPASELLARIKAERKAKLLQRGRRRKPKPREESDNMAVFPDRVEANHLADILNGNSGAMKSEVLWRASGLSIDDFYKQLKREVESGLISEDRDKQLLVASQ